VALRIPREPIVFCGCSVMARLYTLFVSFALIGCAAGLKRRKVMRTAINDRGEEVTEEVWEDSQDASTPEEQDEQADERHPEMSAARSPVGKSPEKALQDDALKEQPGQCICQDTWTVSVMFCMNCSMQCIVGPHVSSLGYMTFKSG